MKKITLSLFTALLSYASVHAQVNVIIDAPSLNTANATTSLRAPNGNTIHTTMRGMYTVPATELTGIGSTILSFGFELESGILTPSGGNLKVYLQNSTNSTYTMGTTWGTTGMTMVYNGNYTLPIGGAPASIDLTFPTAFPFVAGSALKVAYEYTGATFDQVYGAVYTAYNNVGVTMGATASSTNNTSPTTLATTDFRPLFRLGTPNSLTNDISVVNLIAPGKVAKLFGTGHVITAVVRNNSNATIPSIAVGLGVTGANLFTDTQPVTNLAAGATATVNFLPFNPTVNGINTISVAVAPDQQNANNVMTLTQSVTCNTIAKNPPLPATSFSSPGYGLGTTPATGRIFSFIYTPPATASLSSIDVAVPSLTTNTGKAVYGVLLNSSGAVIATTNTVTLATPMYNTFVNFAFAGPQLLTSGSTYYIGLAIPQINTYPIGTYSNASTYSISGYYISSITGGAQTEVDVDFLPMEANLAFAKTTLVTTQTKTIICKGQSVTLTASGPTTFTWSTTGAPTASSIVVSPTVSSSYSISGTDGPSGCKSNSSVLSVSVVACTGLMVNGNNGSEITLFPNPAVNGKSTINGLNGENTVIVYNVLGQSVSIQKTTEETVSIDLSNQPNGTYLVKILDAQNNFKVVKVVNQN